MGDPRIIDVTLDDRTIIRRNADVEQERRIAIFDLLEANRFAANGHEGPFRILLRVEDNRLAIDLKDEGDAPLETIRLGLGRFRRPIRDYFAICDSYFKAVRSDSANGIETIDMARRALHNDAADLLNNVTAARARAYGYTFGDVRTTFTGHELCSGDAWLHSVDWLNIGNSYHPKAAGQSGGYLPVFNSAA